MDQFGANVVDGVGGGSVFSSGSGSSSASGAWVPAVLSREDEIAWIVPVYLGVVIFVAGIGASRCKETSENAFGRDEQSTIPVETEEFTFQTMNSGTLLVYVGVVLEVLQLAALSLRLDLPVHGAAAVKTFADGMFLTSTVGFIPAFARCAFSTGIYTRGGHWFPRLPAFKRASM
jgi:hypothetical protein